MATGLFRTAQRRKAKLRLGLDGPSGSGKTYSALKIAYGITGDWSKIAMIDTEHGSGDLYAEELGPYGILTFDPPFQIERYIRAIKAAEKEGFEVIIIDSLTHAWAGTGGLLDLHDAATEASAKKNSYVAWRNVTPLHNELIDTILQSSAHVIATMRTKVEYVQERDDEGRSVVRKLGMKPVQREGMDYEFTLVFDLSREHVATASKTRISEFDSWIGVPDETVGEQLLAWLEQGADAPAPAASLPVETEPPAPATSNGKPKTINVDQQTTIVDLILERGRTVAGVTAVLNRKGVCPGGLETIPLEAYEDVVSAIRDLKPKDAPTADSPAAPAPAPVPQSAPDDTGSGAPSGAETAAEASTAAETIETTETGQTASESAIPIEDEDLGDTDDADKAFLQGCDDDAKAAEAETPAKSDGTIRKQQLQRLGIICKHLEDNGIMWRAIATSVVKRPFESRKELSFEEGQAVIRTLASIEKTLPEAVAS
jgi:hypothetical protein